MSKEQRKALTDRELLESLHDRLDRIGGRLDAGERRFERLEADLTLTMQWCREIALTRGRDDIASEVDQRMAIRRVAGEQDEPFPLSEEPTNPDLRG